MEYELGRLCDWCGSSPPRRVDKKDANRKTRDFLGFSSFFAVILAFLKIVFSADKKMPIGILEQGSRSEPLPYRIVGVKMV